MPKVPCLLGSQRWLRFQRDWRALAGYCNKVSYKLYAKTHNEKIKCKDLLALAKLALPVT